MKRRGMGGRQSRLNDVLPWWVYLAMSVLSLLVALGNDGLSVVLGVGVSGLWLLLAIGPYRGR